MHAGVGQNILLAVDLAPSVRRHPDNGKIRGSTADVDNEREFLLLDRLLIIQGSRDGFVLEEHLAKTGFPGDFFQMPLGQGVGLLVVVHKPDRPAHDDAVYGMAHGGFRASLQMPDERDNDVLEGNVFIAHFRGFVDQRTAQYAFERTQQPAFATVHIKGYRFIAKEHGIFFRVIKHRAGDRLFLVLQRDKARQAVLENANSGI